jgi:hypothetical protein
MNKRAWPPCHENRPHTQKTAVAEGHCVGANRRGQKRLIILRRARGTRAVEIFHGGCAQATTALGARGAQARLCLNGHPRSLRQFLLEALYTGFGRFERVVTA